jgi:AraC family transcriptional regulator
MEHENIYLQRINAVVDYVREHITDDLSLTTLAQVAHFSPFHFHRIFRSVTGETVNDLVVRLRIERAAALLRSSPHMSVLDAAVAGGFASASNFSRIFKKSYGISARTWDRQSSLKDSKNRKVLEAFTQYTSDMLDKFDQEFEVQLGEMPEQSLAYIRVANAYQSGDIPHAYERLIRWYKQCGEDPLERKLYGMAQNDPDITPIELCSYDWCLPAPQQPITNSEISYRTFPACQIAFIRCTGDIYLVDKVWQYLFRYWLPHSRFQPDNLPALEIYHRQPALLGWEQYDIDCAIPIVSL